MKTTYLYGLVIPALLSFTVFDAGAAAGTEQAHALHEKACISCHARMYGGDGSKMYTRDGRVLSDRTELQQRVAACNAQVSSGWFPDEEEHVADYLNQKYYHFK